MRIFSPFFLLFFRCGGIWRPQASGVANSRLEWQWRLKFKRCRFTRRCNSLLFFFLDHDDCVLWKLCLPCIFLLFIVGHKSVSRSAWRLLVLDFSFPSAGPLQAFLWSKAVYSLRVCCVCVAATTAHISSSFLMYVCICFMFYCLRSLCAHTAARSSSSLSPAFNHQSVPTPRTDGRVVGRDAPTLPRSTAVCGRAGRLFLQLLSLAVPRCC